MESVQHLFFECVVVRIMWKIVSDIVQVKIGESYESMAGFWLSNKKFTVLNMISSAVLWSVWKMRNSMWFQQVQWREMNQVWRHIVNMLRSWKILCSEAKVQELERYVGELQKMIGIIRLPMSKMKMKTYSGIRSSKDANFGQPKEGDMVLMELRTYAEQVPLRRCRQLKSKEWDQRVMIPNG